MSPAARIESEVKCLLVTGDALERRDRRRAIQRQHSGPEVVHAHDRMNRRHRKYLRHVNRHALYGRGEAHGRRRLDRRLHLAGSPATVMRWPRSRLVAAATRTRIQPASIPLTAIGRASEGTLKRTRPLSARPRVSSSQRSGTQWPSLIPSHTTGRPVPWHRQRVRRITPLECGMDQVDTEGDVSIGLYEQRRAKIEGISESRIESERKETGRQIQRLGIEKAPLGRNIACFEPGGHRDAPDRRGPLLLFVTYCR